MSDFSARNSNNFFDELARRLSDRGFEVQRGVNWSPYLLDIFAIGPGIPRGKGGGTIAVLGAGIPSPTARGADAFSSFVSKYVMDNKKALQMTSFDLDILPVIAADSFGQEVIAWVRETQPYRRTITDTFAFPILVSTITREVFCYQKTPFNAGLHYRVLRKWAASNIGFQAKDLDLKQ